MSGMRIFEERKVFLFFFLAVCTVHIWLLFAYISRPRISSIFLSSTIHHIIQSIKAPSSYLFQDIRIESGSMKCLMTMMFVFLFTIVMGQGDPIIPTKNRPSKGRLSVTFFGGTRIDDECGPDTYAKICTDLPPGTCCDAGGAYASAIMWYLTVPSLPEIDAVGV